jgi:hypothetical protein
VKRSSDVVLAALLAVAMGTASMMGCGGGGSDAPDGGAEDGGAHDAGAPDGGAPEGGPGDAGHTDDGATDADAGRVDGGPSCLSDGRLAGERYPAGDGCNFCECQADGSVECTARTCTIAGPSCEHEGVIHGYGERFAAGDGCNECVCAASGLACTRRECAGATEQGAILLESLDEECGVEGFTTRSVLDGLPRSVLEAPFLYDRVRELYPESRADTTATLRLVYDGGFSACRIPSPGQEAIDLQIVVEWVTADGAFDEGFPAYLRRNAGGFVDAWYVAASAPPGTLNGSYAPDCLDPRGFSFDVQVDADGSASASVYKTCETDIALRVGSLTLPPL